MSNYRISQSAQKLRYVASDLIMGALAIWCFNIVRYYLLKEWLIGFSTLWYYLGDTKLVIEQCVIPFGLLGIYWLSGYYNTAYGKSRLQELTTTFFSAFVNTVIIYLLLLINDQTGHRIINYEMIVILFGLLFAPTYLGRLCLTNYGISHFKKKGWKINTLIVGNSVVAKKVEDTINSNKRRLTYNIVGFVELPDETPAVAPLCSLHELEKVCEAQKIDQLILAPEKFDDKKLMNLLSDLYFLEIPIKISPDTFSIVTSGVRLRDIYADPFIDLASPAIGDASKNIKRCFDVSASILLLIILSPLFAVIAMMIKAGSRGPVIYKQERIGRHNKPFMIYKFRTMITDSEPEGPQLSGIDDPRVTRSGRWLRKYRLDELPQFWNVIKGEMSIVGPRPERLFYIRQIVKEAPYYSLLYQVRPGITSWGMVKFGYASSVSQMVERSRFDLIYLANMSLSVDCKILIYTLKTVFSGSGV